MIALETVWFIASLFNYYTILIDENFIVKKIHFIILGILVLLLSYFLPLIIMVYGRLY